MQARRKYYIVPEVKAGWALVKNKAAGICGSDLRIYHSSPQELSPRVVTVVGHEPAGIAEFALLPTECGGIMRASNAPQIVR